MSTQQWLASAAVFLLPLAAGAQSPAVPDPADPNGPAATPHYRSVFVSYRAAHDAAQAPDRLWRGANEAMEKPGGQPGRPKDGGGPQPAPAMQGAAHEHMHPH